jgi:hypothetical protein
VDVEAIIGKNIAVSIAIPQFVSNHSGCGQLTPRRYEKVLIVVGELNRCLSRLHRLPA